MPELKPNPLYKPELGATPTNQQYVFADPNQVINPVTQQTAAQAMKPITVNDLTPIAPIELPKPVTDNTNYQGIIQGGASEADMIAKQMADAAAKTQAEAEIRSQDDFNKLLKGEAPPSGASIYEQTYGVGPMQAEVSALEQDKIRKQGLVTSAQNEFNVINAQIQALNLEAQRIPVQLQQEATGRGITAGGLAPIQTAQLRDVVLRQLPLQGQALIAQGKILTAQGDANTAQLLYDSAQKKFDKVFELRMADMTNLYNYNQDLRNKAWDLFTVREQRQVEADQKEDDRKYQEGRDNLNLAQKWVAEAVSNGQGDLANKISSLDPNDPDFQTKLAVLQGQIKVAEEVNTQVVRLDNGATVLINTDTGDVIKNLGGIAPVISGADEQLYAGLSSATATAVRARVSKFTTESTIQNFATVQDGYNFASAIPDATTNPADDQALIYSLAKALDPGSVVREGEYATAQKYAQSWVKAYGKGVTQAILGTGFLSQEARSNIKQTIKQKYEASKKSYDNVYSQYVSGINSLTGRNDGNSFLIDYAIPKTIETSETPSDNLTDDEIHNQYQEWDSEWENETKKSKEETKSIFSGLMEGYQGFKGLNLGSFFK